MLPDAALVPIEHNYQPQHALKKLARVTPFGKVKWSATTSSNTPSDKNGESDALWEGELEYNYPLQHALRQKIGESDALWQGEIEYNY